AESDRSKRGEFARQVLRVFAAPAHRQDSIGAANGSSRRDFSGRVVHAAKWRQLGFWCSCGGRPVGGKGARRRAAEARLVERIWRSEERRVGKECGCGGGGGGW